MNTTEAPVSTRARLIGTLAGSLYQPTEPAVFREMLSSLPINYREFTFIDIGSGKGRTLLMASDYPFRQDHRGGTVAGTAQHRQENIRKYRNQNQKSFAIESLCVNPASSRFRKIRSSSTCSIRYRSRGCGRAGEPGKIVEGASARCVLRLPQPGAPSMAGTFIVTGIHGHPPIRDLPQR